MSTRANVHFNQWGKTRANIYRHSDGYPEGLGEDLKRFFQDVKSQTQDTRFSDAEYLAAKFVVWQANEYKRNNMLDFLSIGVSLEDHGDIEYLYTVDCEKHDEQGYPILTYKQV